MLFNIAVARHGKPTELQVKALTDCVNKFMADSGKPLSVTPYVKGSLCNLIVAIDCEEADVLCLAQRLLLVKKLKGYCIAPRRADGSYFWQEYVK